MPAKSEAQRRLFYAALSMKRKGQVSNTAAGKIARTMSTAKIREFTNKGPTNRLSKLLT